jgi:hypothetical protein
MGGFYCIELGITWSFLHQVSVQNKETSGLYAEQKQGSFCSLTNAHKGKVL